MRDRCPAIAPPFGHVEHTRPSREVSHLTPEDLDVPTITRRTSAQLGRDLAVSTGHTEWREIPDDIRAVMRESMIVALSKRLGDARIHLKLVSLHGAPPLAAVERVDRLERALGAAARLP